MTFSAKIFYVETRHYLVSTVFSDLFGLGKMQFYLSALDEKLKLNDENPSVGLILCKSKDEEVVRIAISSAVSAMKVATYRTKVIDKELLKKKLHSLPLPEEYIDKDKL